MAQSKLALSHERAKAKLRGEILTHRVRIAEHQDALKSKREQLRNLKATKVATK